MTSASNGKKKRYTGTGTSHKQGVNGEEDFGNQTLPVAQLPDDFDGVPADGSVYLAMARSTSNPYAVASTSYVKPASRAEELGMPSQEWRDKFLARFVAMREALSHTSANPLPTLDVGRLPKARTTEGANKAWYRFLFRAERPAFEGEDRNGETEEAHDPQWEEEDEDGLYNDPAEAAKRRSVPLEPTPILLARFTISQILSVLTAIPYWIALRVSSQPSEDLPPSSSRPAIDPLISRWCFSLLAKLDRRLTSDEISILRVLARACIAAISLRRIELKGTERQGTDQRAESGAWIVVAIVTGVWGQSDLWMDAEEDLGRVAADENGMVS
ncbi:hypothetical protein BCV69DRAFT_298469 [Microstroma glucosiphilum]|uniref:Uncharacterized protein n=1 Tax=Pseudomicrostroma glucosiphilum TaxID=1684307 RepID=A0A316UED0_9BASI|nr:hypothetical protein BCV69DRAFT_298469 [Pseudomicrostroma glucosiphilum]PWN21455.1 hypothetical protein BCV69DRAFT_298469 [Pseudomicrostroma glucosiphilum]